MLPYISMFGYQIPVYGICFFTGICIAVIAALLISRKTDIMGYDIVYSAVITSIGAIIGSKVLFIIVSAKQIIELQIPLINVIKGGFVFYGGLIGGIIGLFIYLKSYKLDIMRFFDIYATVLPLGHSIGRIGCFFGGCCYGMEYNGPLHVVYTVNIGTTPTDIPLLPIQLIEAVFLLCLFAALLILYNRKPEKGTQVLVYGISYSAIRFVLEFFRGDTERGFLLGLSTSQIISLLFFVITIVFFVIKKKHSKLSHKNQ